MFVPPVIFHPLAHHWLPCTSLLCFKALCLKDGQAQGHQQAAMEFCVWGEKSPWSRETKATSGLSATGWHAAVSLSLDWTLKMHNLVLGIQMLKYATHES